MFLNSIVYSQNDNDNDIDTANNKFSSTDISVYLLDFGSLTCRPALWFVHDEGDFYLEARYGFDYPETIGILTGKTFVSKNEKFWITPKLGFLCSFNKFGYNAFSPEINFGSEIGKFNYFSMNQIVLSFNKINPHYIYNFSQCGITFAGWLEVDYASQFYYQFDESGIFLDQGIQFKILIDGKAYIQPWYSFDFKNKIQKFSIGFGYTY
jgi:hypothetical protein